MKKRKVWYATIALTILVVIVTVKYFIPNPPKELIIASGSKKGAYYKYAQMYKKYFAKEGISIKVLSTAGSGENIKLLEAEKVDIAFVQGGTIEKKKENLRSIALEKKSILSIIGYQKLEEKGEKTISLQVRYEGNIINLIKEIKNITSALELSFRMRQRRIVITAKTEDDPSSSKKIGSNIYKEEN